MLGFGALGRFALGQLPPATGVIPGEDTWHQPFPDAIRRRKPMHTGAQQFAAFVKAPPFIETWNVDRFWSFPMPDRIRLRNPMHTGAQQFASFVQFPPFAETVTADRWFVPFSEPVRFRPRLVTANQLFARGIDFPLTTSIVSLSVTFSASATLGGVPTSNYKQILATDNKRKLIYAAEISPWTLSE